MIQKNIHIQREAQEKSYPYEIVYLSIPENIHEIVIRILFSYVFFLSLYTLPYIHTYESKGKKTKYCILFRVENPKQSKNTFSFPFQFFLNINVKFVFKPSNLYYLQFFRFNKTW